MNPGYSRIFALSCLFLSLCFSLSAQIELKLQLMPDGDSWGVYARPHPAINPSENTITPSGQVTLVMPVDFEWNNQVNHAGKWVNNAVVVSPVENPGAKYTSFGLFEDDPHITYISGEETLLFTFDKVGDCPEFLYLIDCGTPDESDEFCLPNSINSNPGNDLSVFDFANGNSSLYFFTDIYGDYAWSCQDSDGDGIVDAHEDTNGNGVFDPDEDASDLFDPSDPSGDGGMKLSLQLMPNGQSWGVYAKPAGGISPSENTQTIEGRTEIVAPLGFEIDSMASNAGTWVHDTSVDGPQDNQGRSYLGFTLVSDDTPIVYQEGSETLLFTFYKAGACPDSLNIIDEETDPVALACTPTQGNLCIFNSLTVNDLGVTPVSEYFYKGSYSESAWSCQDNDGDGIPNAHEDTNGDGSFNDGSDGSDLNDPCDPNHPLSAVLTYEGETVACAGDLIASAYLMVDVEDPASSSYTVEYTDGNDAYTVIDYQTGEQIPVDAFGGAVYQLINVSNSVGCDVTGNLDGVIAIETEGPISFNSQPSSLTACAGTTAFLQATAQNAGSGNMEYQWQRSCDNGTNWEDVADGGASGLSGANSDKLSFENLGSDVSNCEFRLRVSTAHCGAVYTNSAVVKTEGPVNIDSQPIDKQVCAGDQACFTIAATNAGEGQVSYQWQAQEPGSSFWFDMNDNAFVTGANTATLCFEETSNVQDMIVRAVVKTAACNEMYSDFAQLHIDGPLNVGSSPVDQDLQQNENAVFTANITNTSGGFISLQWQESTNGLTWVNVADGQNGTNNISGATSPTLTISPANGLDGRQFRLVGSTASCGEVATAPASLSVAGQVITVMQQPQDQSVCSSSFTFFSVAVQNLSAEPTIFQWEYSTNGTDWAQVPENNVFVGATTANLFVANVSGLAGYQFRCNVVAGLADPVYSNSASLEVVGPFGIQAQAADAGVCFNEGHEFFVELDNPNGLNYTAYWQMSTDQGDSWEAIANNSETGFGGTYEGTETENLNITSVDGLDGYQYRLVVDAGACSTISDPVALTVEDTPNCYPSTDFVDYKLKLRPDGQSWGVWIKAVDDFTPSGYNKALSGRIVIAASAGFGYYDVKSHAGGTWTPGIYKLDAPETPGISYYTFDLTPNSNNLDLVEGGEIMLFSFRNQGDCPDEIYLADGFVPEGFHQNEFSGVDLGQSPNINFHLGEVYGTDEADCNNGTISLGANPNAGFELGSSAFSHSDKMAVYPNPAGDWVNILLPETLGEGTVTHTIFAADGAKLATGSQQRIQVANLPTGLYFVTLELNGQVIDSQKFIKN